MSKPTVQSPEETPLQTSIINHAKLCVQSFQQCLNEASKADKISRPLDGKLSLVQVEDQVARFSVWAANLRVFSSKRDSLDSRLRESPDVQTAIIGLLQTLTYRATTCSRSLDAISQEVDKKTTDDSYAVFHRALEELRDEITLLHKISNTIRKASKETQNARALETFKIKDDEGNVVEDTLQQLFLNYVYDRFPGVSEDIRKRLADSMLLRRRRILYRRERYGKIATRPLQVVPKPVISYPTPEPREPMTQGPMKRRAVQATARSNTQSTTRTATTVSPEKFKRAAVPSVISVSKTVALGDVNELCFPPPPKASLMQSYNKAKLMIEDQCREKHGWLLSYDYPIGLYKGHWDETQDSTMHNLAEEVKAAKLERDEALAEAWKGCIDAIGEITCPYCFHMLPVGEVVNERKWKLHVKSDLDPYVCLFENCDSPNELYTHSDAWRKHMKEHTLRWRCNTKSHGLFTAETKDQFLHHMESSHPAKFTTAQLSVLADRSARTSGPLFPSCPLCGIDTTTDKSIEDHVVGHMRLLALKSLPAYQEDMDNINPFEDHHASIDTSGTHDRSTINNELADLPTDLSDKLPIVGSDASQSPTGSVVWRGEDNEECPKPITDPNAEEASSNEEDATLKDDQWLFMSGFEEVDGNRWNDPILESFRQHSLRHALQAKPITGGKDSHFRYSPVCVICKGPGDEDCQCEHRAFDTAVEMAESRRMQGIYAEVRRWVREKGGNYMRSLTTPVSQMPPGQEGLPNKAADTEEEEEKEKEEGKEDQEEDQTMAYDEVKQASLSKLPKVMDYYYSLVDLYLPGDDDPSVQGPPGGIITHLRRNTEAIVPHKAEYNYGDYEADAENSDGTV